MAVGKVNLNVVVDSERIKDAITSMLNAAKEVPALTIVELYMAAYALAKSAKQATSKTTQAILNQADGELSFRDFLAEVAAENSKTDE